MDGLARSLRRAHRLLALLTATAVLAGGTQALAPTPALAMDNQGNECQNLPTWERTVCELENGGGSGAGGAGGAGGTNGDPGGQTIGHETIEVHDTRPSHCQLSPSLCRPTQVGGQQIGSAGGENLRGSKGVRPIRVGKVGKGKQRTRRECAKVRESRVSLKTTFGDKERRRLDLLGAWDVGGDRRTKLWAKETHLTSRLDRLRGKPNTDQDLILALEAQLADLRHTIALLDDEIDSFDRQLKAIEAEVDVLISKAEAQSSLLNECKRLHGN
jgi:hypothetical protein